MWRFRFLTPSSKLNLWVCIFNLTFFSLKILLQIISALLCFTNFHFIINNRVCLRHYVACRSLFYPWIFLFWLIVFLLSVTNCWSIWFALKLLFMAMQFSICSCSITWFNYLFRLPVIIIFSTSPHNNSNLNKFLHLKQNPHS